MVKAYLLRVFYSFDECLKLEPDYLEALNWKGIIFKKLE